MARLFSGRFAGESRGVIIRVFSKTPECVALRVALTLGLLDELFTFEELVHRVQILIPMNPVFSDCDCGLTRSALLTAIAGKPWQKKVGIVSSDRGDPYGSLLNYGSRTLQTTWTAVIAPEAVSLITPDTLSSVNDAANEGSSVIGIRFDDLEKACTAGIIPNRFAFWKTDPLMEAGGFYPLTHPLIQNQARALFGEDIQGGEEGLTILTMLAANRRVRTRLISPKDEMMYQVPADDLYANTRLAQVAEHKLERMVRMCGKLKLDPRKLRSALI